MSPELLDPERFGFEKCRRTKESDCYALGMVILEVLSGQNPFPRDSPMTVMRKVVDGDRPGRPQGAEGAWFVDALWDTLELCWSPSPSSRPAVDTVFDCLKRVSPIWQPLPPSVDSDAESDTDDEFSFTVSRLVHFPIASRPYPQKSFRISDTTSSIVGACIHPDSFARGSSVIFTTGITDGGTV